MKTKCFIVLISLISSVVLMGDDRENQIIARYVSSLYVVEDYETIVRWRDLDESPKWPMEDQNPPLSVRRAMEVALEHVSSSEESSGNWKFGKICLDEIGRRGHWVYVIELNRLPQGGQIDGVPGVLRVVVLMNGRVIKPALREDR